MFSTPQSKVFFSQELVKGKLIVEEIQLVNEVYDRIWESKSVISGLMKLLCEPILAIQDITQKFDHLDDLIDHSRYILSESNEHFQFEVSLRNDVKTLEHAFFKEIMVGYEDKIKELKHGLLLLENNVQELEQKGLLPYVENPQKNSILPCKNKNFTEFKEKIEIMNEASAFLSLKKMAMIIVSLVQMIIHKSQGTQLGKLIKESSEKAKETKDKDLEKEKEKEPTDKGEKKEQTEKIDTEGQKNIQGRAKKNEQRGITEILLMLQKWGEVANFVLKKLKRDLRNRIQVYSHGNRMLKEGIRNYKKIMKYEQNQSKVRSGFIDMNRQQAIDFLREMAQDLQLRFTRRNIYMVISLSSQYKKTKSCSHLPPTQQQCLQNAQNCLKQVDTNLNNSFLDQCSYLISDRFIANQDENEVIV